MKETKVQVLLLSNHSQNYHRVANCVMVSKIITAESRGAIRAFLALRWSSTVIRKHFLDKGQVISKSFINSLRQDNTEKPKEKDKVGKRGPKPKLTGVRLAAFKRRIQRLNPPTQRSLALEFNISQTLVRKYITRLGF